MAHQGAELGQEVIIQCNLTNNNRETKPTALQMCKCNFVNNIVHHDDVFIMMMSSCLHAVMVQSTCLSTELAAQRDIGCLGWHENNPSHDTFPTCTQ